MDALRRRLCDVDFEQGQDSKCWGTGDPHYRSFDGQRFDFMDFGEYVLYKSRGRYPGEDLEIQVRQGSFRGKGHISSNHGVAFFGGFTCRKSYEILYGTRGSSNAQ